MPLQSLQHPIFVFQLGDFNIDAESYIRHLKPYFFDLAWDDYLYRQHQLSFLIQHVLNNELIDRDTNALFGQYYSGETTESVLAPFIQQLSQDQLTHFKNITPTRRRAMQAFQVTVNNSTCNLAPVAEHHFIQKEGHTLDTVKDWRTMQRIFNPPPSAMLTSELEQLIQGLTKKIISYHPDLIAIDVFVHFTQIVAEPYKSATNSPEGIHQDGMDYIVSGLVIDRENVCGGKSLIFNGSCAENVLFETTLQPSYGLFQPDKNTQLWHVVEPIMPKDQTKPAYRSTIGIDFDLHYSTTTVPSTP